MADELVLAVPAEMMQWLTATAERDFRTPEAQALWVLAQALRRESSRSARVEVSAELTTELRLLHEAAGFPSTRAISRKAAQNGDMVSHTSVHEAIAGHRLLSWRVMEAMVKALDGDPEHFRSLWAANRGAS